MAISIDNDNNRVKYIPRPEDIHINIDTTSSILYNKEKVEFILNHLLSKQKNFIGGSSYISSDEFIKECNRFGFNLRPEGKDINE